MTQENKTRYIGIDFARILAMLMICNLHVLGIGGVLNVVGHQWNIYYILANLLETLSYASVNIYILISGYVGVTSTFKRQKFFKFWLQILFYTLTITILFKILMPGAVPPNEWLLAFTPISHNQYWFMTCYFGLLLLMPILNAAVSKVDKTQLKIIFIGAFLLFSLLPTVFNEEHYGLNDGYSLIWMAMLYVVGAVIRKYQIENILKSWQCWLGIVVTAVLTFYLNWFSFTQWLSYLSPTIVLMAIFFFILCAKMKELPHFLTKAIQVISPMTLGVYLSHVHPLVFNNLIPKIAAIVAQQKFYVFALLILCFTVGIFVLGILIDYFRIHLFKRLATIVKLRNKS